MSFNIINKETALSLRNDFESYYSEIIQNLHFNRVIKIYEEKINYKIKEQSLIGNNGFSIKLDEDYLIFGRYLVKRLEDMGYTAQFIPNIKEIVIMWK